MGAGSNNTDSYHDLFPSHASCFLLTLSTETYHMSGANIACILCIRHRTPSFSLEPLYIQQHQPLQSWFQHNISGDIFTDGSFISNTSLHDLILDRTETLATAAIVKRDAVFEDVYHGLILHDFDKRHINSMSIELLAQYAASSYSPNHQYRSDCQSAIAMHSSPTSKLVRHPLLPLVNRKIVNHIRWVKAHPGLHC